MTRILGIASALLVALLLLVPTVAAADPPGFDDHLLVSTGGDIILTPDQHVDLLIVVTGTATVEGDVGSILVVDGTLTLRGARTEGIVAVRSQVRLDDGAVVAGDIRTLDSTVDRASGAVVDGTIGDLAAELIDATVLLGGIGFVAYLAFALTALVAGVALAGLASRQVRKAEAIISGEPLIAVAASLVGLVVIVTAAALAMLTVVGIPVGMALLVLVLPVLLVAGHLVAGIWIGDQVLARVTPGVTRDRPYLAAVVGLLILGAIGWIPFVGAIVILVGFGAVMLEMWRVLRGHRATASVAGRPLTAPSPG